MIRLLLLCLVSLPLAAQQALPLNPEPQPTASTSWKLLVATDWAVTAWDAKVSVSHHVGCVETSPLFGAHPSPARYWTQMAVTTATVQAISWQLRRRGHTRIANLLVAGDAANHAFGVATNYSACRVSHG